MARNRGATVNLQGSEVDLQGPTVSLQGSEVDLQGSTVNLRGSEVGLRGSPGTLFEKLPTIGRSALKLQHRIAAKSKPKSMEGIAKIVIWV